MKNKHHMMIAGATGLIGATAIEHFTGLPDWSLTALSRRKPAARAGLRHISVDLTDYPACERALSEVDDVTHLLYAALYEKPDLVAGWRDEAQMAVNLAMLQNLINVLDIRAPALRHITILQGSKAYGSHIEPAPVPCKERAPRHPHQSFYWLQEDFLRSMQPKRGWNFSILRPQMVMGYALNSPMNVVAAVGAYAVIQRELGRPLCFPGGGPYVYGASDSRVIARAVEFVGTHEIAANETYNVNNGDVWMWREVWPRIARHFGMALGEPTPQRLSETMPAHEALWTRIGEKYALAPVPLSQLVGSSWQFTDGSFAYGIERPAHSLLSSIKLRQHGFTDCLDTEDALIYWLTRMQDEKVLPR
ncbi:MAG: NAD-dependent epimerase/dehydratase family protein [Janthinobacterium lividum]